MQGVPLAVSGKKRRIYRQNMNFIWIYNQYIVINAKILTIFCVVIHIIIWYINTRNKNEIKNGLQSSQQWCILDTYLRFNKKKYYFRARRLLWNLIIIAESKSNRYSIAVDDYFFALLTSFPSIYPAPPQIAIRVNNAS